MTKAQQYAWAKQALVKPDKAKKLADSMTPTERRDVLDPNWRYRQWKAAQPPPLPWYERYNPVERAGALIDPLINWTIDKGPGVVGGLARSGVESLLTSAQSGGRTSSLRPTGALGRVPAPVVAASVAPAQAGQLAGDIGLGAAKMLTAGGGAAYSVATDPVHGGWHVLGQGIDMLRGLGQATAMVYSLSDPQLTNGQRTRGLSEVFHAMLDSYVKTYGPDASFHDAFDYGQRNQLYAAFDAVSVLSPGARIATIGKALLRGDIAEEPTGSVATGQRARAEARRARGRSGDRRDPAVALAADPRHGAAPLRRHLPAGAVRARSAQAPDRRAQTCGTGVAQTDESDGAPSAGRGAGDVP